MNETRHRARKRFGQNFLQDQAVIDRILAAVSGSRPAGASDTHFVEIGPGQGALTYPFIDQLDSHPDARLTIIELDRDLAASLRSHLDNRKNVELVEADALQYDYTGLAEQSGSASLVVFGNLPYNISTPLIFHLLAQQNRPNTSSHSLFDSMTFMLQKEVVDRICAQPNTKAYGRISIMTQLHCHCEKLFDVPPSAFRPAPKVTSSIVQLLPRNDRLSRVSDLSLFSKVVQQSFAQRRKTLRNNLNELISARQLANLDIDPARRAETLLIEEYIRIANYLCDS